MQIKTKREQRRQTQQNKTKHKGYMEIGQKRVPEEKTES